MAINVSVQYNDGLVPDTTLLTQGYYHRGTHLKCHEEVLYLKPMKQMKNFIHAVESPYGLIHVVKRKCISLHQLQYCNASCVLDDNKPLSYWSMAL